MDDTKRRALIRSLAAKKMEFDDVAPTTMVASNSSTKRKPLPKETVLLRSPKSLWSL